MVRWARLLMCEYLRSILKARRQGDRKKTNKLNAFFLYVSLGNSFPYLKDNVASISVSRKPNVLCFWISLGEEGLAMGSYS